MTYENLKAYVQKVYELESSLYQQRQLGRHLQYEINFRYNYSGDTRSREHIGYYSEFFEWEFFGGSIVLFIIIGALLISNEIVPSTFLIAFPIFGFFFPFIIELFRFNSVKHHNAEVDRENKEIAKHNAQLCTKMRKQADVIQAELDQVNNSIAQTLHM